MPTPSSASNGNKRRRTGNYEAVLSDPISAAMQDEEEEEERSGPEGLVFDPNQNEDERRQLRADMRNNHRDMEGTRCSPSLADFVSNSDQPTAMSS
jgi:hypothetical protein